MTANTSYSTMTNFAFKTIVHTMHHNGKNANSKKPSTDETNTKCFDKETILESLRGTGIEYLADEGFKILSGDKNSIKYTTLKYVSGDNVALTLPKWNATFQKEVLLSKEMFVTTQELSKAHSDSKGPNPEIGMDGFVDDGMKPHQHLGKYGFKNMAELSDVPLPLRKIWYNSTFKDANLNTYGTEMSFNGIAAFSKLKLDSAVYYKSIEKELLPNTAITITVRVEDSEIVEVVFSGPKRGTVAKTETSKVYVHQAMIERRLDTVELPQTWFERMTGKEKKTHDVVHVCNYYCEGYAEGDSSGFFGVDRDFRIEYSDMKVYEKFKHIMITDKTGL